MYTRSVVAMLAALPWLATCCPTVWVQVSKDNPAPWPSVEPPIIAETPLLVPLGVANRFDVLHNGAPTIAMPGYTDVFDPRDDGDNARTHAYDALARILAEYSSEPPPSCQPVTAEVVCLHAGQSGRQANCHVLRLAKLDTEPAVVSVRGKRYTVANTINEDPSRTTLDLSTWIDATDGQSLDICLGEPALSHTLLSFVQFSDIQIRDPSMTLTDRRLSHQLDWFAPLSSFEYDEDLAFYNQYVVEAVFATINKIVATAGQAADRPAFVIHTGDSIDVGAMSELGRFHQLIDRLEIPFFELFGNHDVLVFGNLTPTATRDSDATCTPISALLGGRNNWLAPNKLCVDQVVHCPTCIGKESDLVAVADHGVTRQRFMTQLTHVSGDFVAQPVTSMARAAEEDPAADPLYCKQPIVRKDPYSRAHGFDLNTRDGRLDGDKLGYYAFTQPLHGTDRSAVFVGLNSEDLQNGHGGTRGRLGAAQVTWLKAVLACVRSQHPRDLVFVLSHQPLSEIDIATPTPAAHRQTLADILEASPNVVGFLYGHNHEHAICGDQRRGVCRRFWEIETASLLEFPQEGRLIRIKQVGSNLGFLELTSLRERLAEQTSDLARYVQLARRGAERDYCHTHRGTARCSADQRPYRVDGRDANARLFFQMP